jgi:antitoxin HicB
MHYKLPLILEPQPEGGFTLTSPLLPELLTECDTVEEALDNARDALAAVLEIYQELSKPLPPGAGCRQRMRAGPRGYAHYHPMKYRTRA